jgi:hypothetical protein
MSALAPTVTTKAEPQNLKSQTAARGLRLTHLWLLIPLAVAWFGASIDYIEPFDFWWNVKSGQIMMETGRFLGTDVLVWSPVREPYSNPQWGSQILFYWLFDASPYLLLTMRALIISATMGLLLWLCFWRTGSLKVASIATIVAYLTAWTNYGMRPQLFAFLPFVAFLFLLERKDTHSRWLPLLVPIMLFWVNVHGSFFLGVALMGIYAFGTFIERVGSQEGRGWLFTRAAAWQAIWLGAATLASLANPYFVGIYNYFFVATNDPVARGLNVEWQAPTIYGGTGILFYSNVLILLTSIYFSKRRMRPTEILLIMAFAYLSLTSLRNVMWWGWITAPILAQNLAAWGANWREGRSRKAEKAEAARPGTDAGESSADREAVAGKRAELPSLNVALAVMIVGTALLFTPLWRQANPLVPAPAKAALAASTPSKLAEFLKKGEVPAPLFNYMEWGGYLEWELYPRYLMFLDGRFEARKVEVWMDYLSVSGGRADWQSTLDRYGIKTLVLNKDFQKDLLPYVQESKTWHKVYEDKAAIVYTR